MDVVNGNGDCYQVAGRAAMDAMGDVPGFLVAHGTVVGQGPVSGVQFGHAWIEIGDTVIDMSNGLNATMQVDAYYALGKITDVSKYTAREAMNLMVETGHFGPW